MSKRKFRFNDKLIAKYPFLEATKIESAVHCNKCRAVFSIGSGADIDRHLSSRKHSDAMQAASASASIQPFFPNDQDLDLAGQEGVWAFHLLQENHSFRSSDCATKIFKNCFNMKKFACARTKCEAIVTNVFAPHGSESD